MDCINSRIIDTPLEGIHVIQLQKIVDERGSVLHMLQVDSPIYQCFGEIYFSEINVGITKAWKRHTIMTQHFAVPVGKIELVVYDARPNSSTINCFNVYKLGRPDAYNLIVIPPMLWYGFQNINNTPALLANCTDIAHTPEESENLPLNNNAIPFGFKDYEL